jgi:hypothetical protein
MKRRGSEIFRFVPRIAFAQFPYGEVAPAFLARDFMKRQMNRT